MTFASIFCMKAYVLFILICMKDVVFLFFNKINILKILKSLVLTYGALVESCVDDTDGWFRMC